MYLVVYVDDLLTTGNNESYIASIKKDLKKIFEMTDMGHLHYFLGIEVTQHPKYIFLSQKKYIGELLNKFCMTDCNPISTPMEQKMKLTSSEGKEFEDATSIDNLLEVLSTLQQLDQIFLMLLAYFQGSCINLVKDTVSCKKSSKILEGDSRRWTQVL